MIFRLIEEWKEKLDKGFFAGGSSHGLINTNSIQKRALQLLYNDYTNTYDSLLANKQSMELKRYRTLALEIPKILNVLNPTYIQDIPKTTK